MIAKKMITRKTAIGITLIVLIGLTSWGLAGALEEQQYIDQGKAEYNRGNYDAAIYLFNKAVDLDPDHEYLYNDLGLCYVALGDMDLAIPEFDKAIELNSDCVEAYYNRGLAYFGQGRRAGNLPNAILDFTKAIELEPDNVDAYYNRGITYNNHYNSGRNYDKEDTTNYYTKAVADFDKVLELDPTYVLAYAGKGNAGYRNEEYDTAEENFAKALESESAILEESGGKGLAGVYASRARNLKAMADYNGSIADYNTAIALDPELSIAISHQASNYKIVEDWDKAIDMYDLMIELKKNDPTYKYMYSKYYGKGDCYCQLGQYDKAMEMYDDACAECEKNRPGSMYSVYEARGGCHCEFGEYDKAQEMYNKAVDEYAENRPDRLYRLYVKLGDLQLELEDYDEAIVNYNKAIELAETEDIYVADAHKGLGIAYKELGETEKAKAALETAISLYDEYGVDGHGKKESIEECQKLIAEL
ncbi:Tetratricopeptide (TPR) repeat containing protein [Methanophagales archaeon]|nr:Tetratricopeptide (TPR) repeat containing protein [Methanophagales archaeon]